MDSVIYWMEALAAQGKENTKAYIYYSVIKIIFSLMWFQTNK